ncbi:MAG: aspartate/glutamate racemase family protein [Anaerolineales bacterium]|nr:aspartate/glutamate racemase family protein [Anaerolineales bacterium]
MRHWNRIGLLVPSSDTVMEPDLWRRLPPQASLHVARMYLEDTTVAGEEKMLLEELAPAARRLASINPELIIFGCTSAAALHGMEGDAAIANHVQEIAGCDAITLTQASISEIKKLQVKRLFLFTPYVAELTERLANTFGEAGLHVIGSEGLGLDNDLAIAAVSPEEIRDYVAAAVKRNHLHPDAVFVSCTTFRAFDAAEGIERELGIPVVTSNRAALEFILHYLRTKTSI